MGVSVQSCMVVCKGGGGGVCRMKMSLSHARLAPCRNICEPIWAHGALQDQAT